MSKEYVIETLAELGISIQQIVQGRDFSMWEILLASPEDCITLIERELQNKERQSTKDCIIFVWQCMKYFISGQQVEWSLLQHREISEIILDKMVWRFHFMVNHKFFNTIPNWIDINVQKLPVIVSERKPVCWHCAEAGHLSAVCLGKMTTEWAVETQQKNSPPSTDAVKIITNDQTSRSDLSSLSPEKAYMKRQTENGKQFFFFWKVKKTTIIPVRWRKGIQKLICWHCQDNWNLYKSLKGEGKKNPE